MQADPSQPPAWLDYWLLGVFLYVGAISLIGIVNFYLHADRRVLREVRRNSTPFNRQWMILQAAERIYSPRGYRVFRFLKVMLYGLFVLMFVPLVWVQITGG